MKINLNYLKKIYSKLSDTDKEEQNIHCFNDFLDYIKETIIDNLYYDFSLTGVISRKEMFKMEMI